MPWAASVSWSCPDAYTGQAAGIGGGRQRSLARRLKFCAVAVSSTSSFTPLKPRKRSRSSLRMRFMWANRSCRGLRFLELGDLAQV